MHKGMLRSAGMVEVMKSQAKLATRCSLCGQVVYPDQPGRLESGKAVVDAECVRKAGRVDVVLSDARLFLRGIGARDLLDQFDDRVARSEAFVKKHGRPPSARTLVHNEAPPSARLMTVAQLVALLSEKMTVAIARNWNRPATRARIGAFIARASGILYAEIVVRSPTAHPVAKA